MKDDAIGLDGEKLANLCHKLHDLADLLDSNDDEANAIPARTDTRWFHDYIYQQKGAEIRFIKGRLRFENSTNSAPFPSMVVIFNNQHQLPHNGEKG